MFDIIVVKSIKDIEKFYNKNDGAYYFKNDVSFDKDFEITQDISIFSEKTIAFFHNTFNENLSIVAKGVFLYEAKFLKKDKRFKITAEEVWFNKLINFDENIEINCEKLYLPSLKNIEKKFDPIVRGLLILQSIESIHEDWIPKRIESFLFAYDGHDPSAKIMLEYAFERAKLNEKYDFFKE